MTDEELTALYNAANDITHGKNPPISTARIFAAMRSAATAEREACAKAMDDLAEDYKAAGLREDNRVFWPDSDKWNQRSIAFRDAAAAIRARSKT